MFYYDWELSRSRRLYRERCWDAVKRLLFSVAFVGTFVFFVSLLG